MAISAVFLSVSLVSLGCGNNYRPVVSAINPVGPSNQPQKYAVALADPGNGAAGVATLIDFSGDTVVGTITTTPAPTYLAVDQSATGASAFIFHQGTGLFEAIGASQTTNATPTFINTKLTQTTLPPSSGPISATALVGTALYIVNAGTNRVSAYSDATPPLIRQELPVPVNPTYVVGTPSSSRVYVLSKGASNGTDLGVATAVENTTTNAISNSFTIGRNPVYGVMNGDSRRAFLLNKGGDGSSGTNGTVSVVNVQSNSLDTVSRIVVGQNPVWADVDTAINELAVLNAGDGVSQGSLTIVNIPLCSSISLGANANCDSANPIDATGFGNILATIPVGVNPVMVTVLQDANKAYVANGDGTVTVIDLQRMVATSTITVGGKLNWISATSGTPTGKVYVSASDTQVATVIRTDTDAVITTVPLQGYGIAVRATAP